MNTAVADLSHNENISPRFARSLVFFKTVYACVNEAGVDTLGVDTLGVRNFYATSKKRLKNESENESETWTPSVHWFLRYVFSALIKIIFLLFIK